MGAPKIVELPCKWLNSIAYGRYNYSELGGPILYVITMLNHEYLNYGIFSEYLMALFIYEYPSSKPMII